MKVSWLSKTGKRELIVFFAGWAMDENPVKHLKNDSYDIAVFYDYRNLMLPDDFWKEFSAYKNIFVLSWSMGVWAAGLNQAVFPMDKSVFIAFNGTGMPVDDRFGIPVKIFSMTINNMSEKGRELFFQGMFEKEDDYHRFTRPERNLEEQVDELIRLRNMTLEKPLLDLSFFKKAFIGKKDKIIPSKNQSRYWNNQTEIKMLDAGHYPFFLWDSWEKIIENV
ncbi:MAG TPA: hypothetical protein DHW82_09330 [Spirochaetia bacterium]|nr:MAG: hypothetical protein A2Y41_08440 [Spirochaetes bacterium GWB1_36_13]HCL57192.1 hypothetical protein [Spirochaetia bacterium]